MNKDWLLELIAEVSHYRILLNLQNGISGIGACIMLGFSEYLFKYEKIDVVLPAINLRQHGYGFHLLGLSLYLLSQTFGTEDVEIYHTRKQPEGGAMPCDIQLVDMEPKPKDYAIIDMDSGKYVCECEPGNTEDAVPFTFVDTIDLASTFTHAVATSLCSSLAILWGKELLVIHLTD